MALDLTGIQGSVAELILVDKCTIWRDSEGTRDDSFDPVTLAYSLSSDATPVETDLACKAKWMIRNSVTGEGGQAISISEYVVSFGLPFDNVRDGDLIEITECPHDPELVGKKMRVFEAVFGSLVIFRKVRTRLRQQAVDIP